MNLQRYEFSTCLMISFVNMSMACKHLYMCAIIYLSILAVSRNLNIGKPITNFSTRISCQQFSGEYLANIDIYFVFFFLLIFTLYLSFCFYFKCIDRLHACWFSFTSYPHNCNNIIDDYKEYNMKRREMKKKKKLI